MDSIAKASGAYLAHGLGVWIFPVTTFQRAADRELPLTTIFAVALILATVRSAFDFLLGMLFLGEALAGFLMWGILITTLGALVVFLFGSSTLYGAARLFGGQTTAGRLFSATLVFLAIEVFISGLALCLLFVASLIASEPNSAFAAYRGLAPMGSFAFILIAISYTVLAARFGGRLGWPAAVGATAVCLGVIAIIYAAVIWNTVPTTPFEPTS